MSRKLITWTLGTGGLGALLPQSGDGAHASTELSLVSVIYQPIHFTVCFPITQSDGSTASVVEPWPSINHM